MERPNRATIHDIANKAGVSITTVSNVINGKTSAMTEATLQRIQDVMLELDYRPNSVARGLALQRTATIGLVLSEIETPLFLQAVTPIEYEARKAGYGILLSSAANVSGEIEAMRLLYEKQVDGFVIISTSDPRPSDHLYKIHAKGVPLVLINRFDSPPGFDQVNWDNKEGVSTAVDYLSKLGHKNISILAGPENRRSTQERLQGFNVGLQRNNLLANYPAMIYLGDYTATVEDWKKSIDQLLSIQDPPTAIIASDDIVAEVVVRSLQEKGLNIPKDISVVGIDDHPFSQYMGLTTIQLPVAEAGRQGIQLLLNRISNPNIEPQTITLPCPLIIRDTCGERRKNL
jgi:LacI family transcriptional regulator